MAENKETITWSPTYACGITIIDNQHKGLINMVNDIYKHSTGDPTKEREYLSSITDKLVKYVKIHFKTEEAIMKKTNFSGLGAHKKAHDKFVFTVLDTVQKYKENNRLALSSLFKFLRDWILEHIAVVDKIYFKHLHSLGVTDSLVEIILRSAARTDGEKK